MGICVFKWSGKVAEQRVWHNISLEISATVNNITLVKWGNKADEENVRT
jgi:hypothetical protein